MVEPSGMLINFIFVFWSCLRQKYLMFGYYYRPHIVLMEIIDMAASVCQAVCLSVLSCLRGNYSVIVVHLQ